LFGRWRNLMCALYFLLIGQRLAVAIALLNVKSCAHPP